MHQYFRKIVVVVAAVLLMSQPVLAAQQSLGFVTSSGIWFSKTVFFEGDTVRVMTVVVNNTYATLTGTLGFFDNTTPIAEVAFSLGFEEARQISANWSPRSGQRNVHARFLSLVGKKDDGTTVQLNPSSIGGATLETSIFVDVDTDRDGIGDSQDQDKDNDGVSDTEEIRRGTNVTNPDTDGDGINDGDEIAKGSDPTRVPQPVVPEPVVETKPVAPAAQPTPATTAQPVTAPRITTAATGVVASTTSTTSTIFTATTTVDVASAPAVLEQGSRTDRPAGTGVLPIIAYATAALAAVFAALYVRMWARNRE